ncbi:phytanoyl-CoA dioxygenase family protein [Xanthomonas nasturtii]|uniref:phytanoyl-CoA dioxygenase family protein n=1 Tax=Xanthomonas nasturtii TaxID=1843581 RepID=UPI002B22CA40|nr:phytanoyl-CoA dioxygenase family protein [Xanthomonas nasturtii]MEA9580418.1 phytanoyl-CoA dioxygenase family protein [Xanthomonas nasturtii]
MHNLDVFLHQLDVNGFSVLKGLHPHSLIDEHVASYRALNEREGISVGENLKALPEERQSAIKQARHTFHERYPASRELFFSPILRRFLGHYFDEDAVLRQPETGFFHRNTPPHNDSLDLRVSVPGTEVRVWHALEDVHPDAGPMYVLPGSHSSVSMSLEEEVGQERPDLIALLRSQMHETTASDFYEATRPLWAYVRQYKFGAAVQSIPLEPLLLNKGDAVVFRSDLVHGTCHCNKPGLTRAYAVNYWSSRSAEWYQSRSYWGAPHDHRRSENVIRTEIHGTPVGLEICFRDMHAAYVASFKRSVLAKT